MPFGIDTFRTHLDQIKQNALDSFKLWNGGGGGGTGAGAGVAGGDPEFAGRNFLGGDFLWGHAEATNASSEPVTVNAAGNAVFPVPAGDPSPAHPENLRVTVPLIAPVQAPQAPRQQVTGERGVLFGQLDARAICRRVSASTGTEFVTPNSRFVKIWLAVDPAVDFSADYWAGWSDCVNKLTLSVPVVGNVGYSTQPFQACVLCSYTAGADGLLRPDPHVVAALASRAYPALSTASHGFWADAPVGPHPNDALAANPNLNWNSFDPATMPLLWRLRNGFLQANAPVVNIPFDVDAANPGGNQNAKDYMLVTQQWQPNVPTISNIGFIAALQDLANHEINNAAITCMNNNVFPDLVDNSRNLTNVPGGRVRVVGRYLKTPKTATTPSRGFSMSADEAGRLSNAGFEIFTIWESVNNQSGGEPTLDQRHEADWGSFNVNIHKNIHYFNPANHAGTEDGQNAFTYCGEVLQQPPQTPVFFAVDFDPLDLPDPNNPHADATHPPPGSPPGTDIAVPPGWPALPNAATRRQWMERYFELVKGARDDYARINSDRYYLIGVYGCGEVLRWCYEQGFASAFWQAASSGHSGSQPPRWPWYHCNRWQYQFSDAAHPIAWNCVDGRDPDADWGDGGTWNLTDPIAAHLSDLEKRERAAVEQEVQKFWGQLLRPGQVHP